jgi:membrane-bound lytic murein transglycosylase D
VYRADEVQQVLRGSSQHIDAALQRRGMVRRGYVVKKGDTLRKIGRRFDLSVGSLARINAFDREHAPTPGDLLVVYVPDNRGRGTVDPPAPTGFYAGPAPVVSAPIRRPSTPITAGVPSGRARATPPRRAAPSRAPSTASTARLPGRSR